MTLTSVFNRADAAPAKASPAIAHQTDVSGKYIPNAVAIAEQLHPTANLSYKVAGKRYYPTKKVTADFSQTGRASWYGPGFHGKKTSNGERFDMNMMTAAHPTLPIPSYVRVTNLDNGKTAVVRINDRGPFHGNRAIDLSKAAANKLGFLSKGTANVRIDVLTADERTNPPANTLAHKDDVANITTGKNIYVSLKTFDNKHEAQNFLETTAAHLKQIQAEQRAIMVKHGKAYLVRVGPFTEQEHADKIHNGLKQDVI
ncbi:MAG: septal ring lytic transglycosylase RlpA family protein [Alysiella sp.]|uniref:septal ring lytic transglycosylase RlpA family protein n=1 Tax=Alysiella sp. TaxID=1872483 RepID=UPI0026DB1CB2|nr:septal ring lytic transglycosylase RlpA family protein [Alysiella sp.]MDO4434068.1 septal ring lytic transglycosylase RlpA family protein [Alysiella sp.]